MTSELRVDKIHNEGGDNDSGIDLSTNDNIVLKTANTTRLTMNATGQTTIVGEGGTNTTNLQQGLAKYWVFYLNMSVLDSFNSSGLTDNDTGDATLSITNDFSNANYSTLHGADGGSQGDSSFRFCEGMSGTTAKAAGAYRVRSGYFSGDASTRYDDGDNSVSFMGDLA